MLSGLAGGFAFVVRPQNAPFAFLPLFCMRPGRRSALIWSGAGLLAASPQFLAGYRIYGDVAGFLWGHPGWRFATFERSWSWEPVISCYHGLLTWPALSS